MKYTYAFLLLISFLLPKILFAQYETIRQPITPQEMALYKKNKVLAELQRMVDKGVPKNYKAIALDTGGRLLASITYDRKQYYLYDNTGRVMAHLDSIRNDDGTYTEKSYSFTYDEKYGKLLQAITPEGTINFTYDPRGNVLTQKHFSNDTVKHTKYLYDALGRTIGIEGYDFQNKLISRISRAFSSNGTLHREEIVGNFPAGTDSTIILYLYDANKNLQKKQIFSFRKFYVSMSGTNEPTHSAEQQSVGTFDYTYDKKGNKLSEKYTNSIDKFAGYYLTWQYDERGLITKKTIKKAVGEPDIILYEYGYFE